MLGIFGNVMKIKIAIGTIKRAVLALSCKSEFGGSLYSNICSVVLRENSKIFWLFAAPFSSVKQIFL